MAHIPKGARWYLADVVLEHTVEGDPRNVVHVNIHLIEAESPDQAYEKATALGRESEDKYTNTAGQEVHVKFRGLRQLNVIHDELSDGAELAYEESTAVPEPELAGWLRSREQLAVFRDRLSPKPDGPNYMPESVAKELEEAGFSREDIEGRIIRHPDHGDPPMKTPKNIDVLFIAGFGPIVRDPTASRKFYSQTLGLPFKEDASGYLYTADINGVKHFALWPLAQAAESCFGTDQWPSHLPVPQAWIEFDVANIETATEELKSQGYQPLVAKRTEPWGQTVTRLLGPEGLLVGITYTPQMRK